MTCLDQNLLHYVYLHRVPGQNWQMQMYFVF